jgi:hypothetical protein
LEPDVHAFYVLFFGFIVYYLLLFFFSPTLSTEAGHITLLETMIFFFHFQHSTEAVITTYWRPGFFFWHSGLIKNPSPLLESSSLKGLLPYPSTYFMLATFLLGTALDLLLLLSLSFLSIYFITC